MNSALQIVPKIISKFQIDFSRSSLAQAAGVLVGAFSVNKYRACFERFFRLPAIFSSWSPFTMSSSTHFENTLAPNFGPPHRYHGVSRS